MPKWVDSALDDYQKRFRRPFRLDIHSTPPARGNKRMETEGDWLLNQCKSGLIVALDVQGKSIATEALAAKLQQWQPHESKVNWLIGGPDGHSDAVLARADLTLSLSALTLPHALARVLLVEQLYRATSIIQNHPYHREG